tara:strand:+ start:592 stop:1371 length:780 start_codon:yes stop_codon:yes gene_type:complete
MSTQLVVIESDAVVVSMQRASTALAEAITISQTKKIMDVAAAAEIYARRQHLSDEAEQMARTVRVEALCKLGGMLQAAPKNDGARGVGKSGVPLRNPTLDELGLTKKESALAQKLASLPEKAFQQVRDGHVTVAKAIAAVEVAKKLSAPSKKSTDNRREAPQDAAANTDRRDQDPKPYVWEGPSEAEQAYLEQAEQEFTSKLQVLLDADDALATATAKWKQAELRCEQLQMRVNGLVNENGELVRDVKYWRGQARKAAA